MNKDVRLWEELSKEERDEIAMTRFRYSEEEQLKSLQLLLKTPPEIIENLKKSQAKFNKEWRSKEFQVSEAMDGANENFYYTNIEKGYTEYHLSKLIYSLWEDEEWELEKTIQKHINKSKLKSQTIERQIDFLNDVVIGLKSEILDDCSFGCEWYENDAPDINNLAKLCKWYNNYDFETLVASLIVIDEIQDYVNDLEYPESLKEKHNRHAQKNKANDDSKREDIKAEIEEWNYECLSNRIAELDIIYINRVIWGFLTSNEMPEYVKPIFIFRDRATSKYALEKEDLSSFIWVVWYHYKDIYKYPQVDMAKLIQKIFPSVFVDKLTRDPSPIDTIKSHLRDDEGKIIRIPREYTQK